MFRQAIGMAADGAYAGLALLGFTALFLAGTPVDVLLAFWAMGAAAVAVGPVSQATWRWARARRGGAR